MLRLLLGQKPEEARGQGAVVSAVNAISPAIGGALKLAGKGVSKLGGTAIESAKNIMARQKIPQFNVIQRLFGKETIQTSAGEPFVSPEVTNIITKYKIPIPPQENIAGFKPALDSASE